MRTDKKDRLLIAKKIVENIQNDVGAMNGIEVFVLGGWREATCTFDKNLFRLKPESIKLRNGIEIPKPLHIDGGIDEESTYYVPDCSQYLYGGYKGKEILEIGFTVFYDNESDAIKASEILFGA